MLQSHPDSTQASGMLTLIPISAELNKNVALLSSQSPYVVFLLGKNKVESEVCKHGGKTPVWNATLQIAKLPNDDIMNVDLYHDRYIGKDKHIGGAEIILSQFFETGEANGWFNLYHGGEYRGRINIGILLEKEPSHPSYLTEVDQSKPMSTTIPTNTDQIGSITLSHPSWNNTLENANAGLVTNFEKKVRFNEAGNQINSFGNEPQIMAQQGTIQTEQVPVYEPQVILPNLQESGQILDRAQPNFFQERMPEVPIEKTESIKNKPGIGKAETQMVPQMDSLNSDMRNQSEKMTQENLAHQQSLMNQAAYQQALRTNEVPDFEVIHQVVSEKEQNMIQPPSSLPQNIVYQTTTQNLNAGMHDANVMNQWPQQGNIEAQQQGTVTMMEPQIKVLEQDAYINTPNAQGVTMIDGISVIPLQDAIKLAIRQSQEQSQSQNQTSSSGH